MKATVVGVGSLETNRSGRTRRKLRAAMFLSERTGLQCLGSDSRHCASESASSMRSTFKDQSILVFI